MKYYAVIDTNVLVSAMLKWNSIPGHVMELVFEGPIVPLLDERIVKEYREVLARPKFHLTEDILRMYWKISKEMEFMWTQSPLMLNCLIQRT